MFVRTKTNKKNFSRNSKMKLFTFLAFSLLKFNFLIALTKECADLFYNNVHPYDCCHYPKVDTKKTTADHCYKDCYESEDDCCIPDCIYHELRSYDNGKFSIEQFMSQYEADIKDKKISKEKWLPVVKESIKKCKELSEEEIS
jgi:hypothetical protein